jgi:cystathionine beta-lyase/cystathionine gamma-synthase
MRLERAMVELEGGETAADLSALATSSGMAAIHVAALSCAGAGRPLVAASDLYGGTHALFSRELPAIGVPTRVVDIADREHLRAALDGAAMLLVETISNPTLRVADIPAMADLAHAAGATFVVDNTFATPLLCRPLGLGADVVMHSLTKYISGHADVVGGILVYRNEMDDRLREIARVFRPTPSPMDTWLALRGLRTLALRMEVASGNAAELAMWLAGRGEVSRVDYPGLPTHPTHEVASRVLDGGFGAMLSFTLRGGLAAARNFVEHLQLITLMPSFASVATTISHPASTSHRGLVEAELETRGISPGMLRMSAGIEDVADIRSDLEQALR